MFERYSDFCNMQMKYLMTSSTQPRPNKRFQLKNIPVISVNITIYYSYQHSCKVSVQSTYYFRRYSSFTELVEQRCPMVWGVEGRTPHSPRRRLATAVAGRVAGKVVLRRLVPRFVSQLCHRHVAAACPYYFICILLLHDVIQFAL